MTGQQKLEALLRAARAYESHEIAMAAPEVQAAIREMAPLVERDPVREFAHALWHNWDDERDCMPAEYTPGPETFAIYCARTAANAVSRIDAELARLRTSSAPRIK